MHLVLHFAARLILHEFVSEIGVFGLFLGCFFMGWVGSGIGGFGGAAFGQMRVERGGWGIGWGCILWVMFSWFDLVT